MAIFTAFCRDSDGSGATWIDTVEADDIEQAKQKAAEKCATAWQRLSDDPLPLCIGLAVGDVKIAYWDEYE